MPDGSAPQRQMYDVDLACDGKLDDGSPCPERITKLPFMPTPGRKVYCRTHNQKMRAERPPTQRFVGPWTCSACGATIPDLPFQPRSTENLLCRDCLNARQQKAA